MSGHRTELERRSFLSRLGVGAAAVGAAFGLGGQRAEAQTPGAAFQPAKHAEDDWFDQVPGKHRFFMDTVTPEGFGQAIFFANNIYTGSRTGYALTDADSAIIICARHQSTAFAYTDAIWAKYGAALSERAGGFMDPKTKAAPIVNVYQVSGYGAALPNTGVLLDPLIKRGLRLAVCQMATRANAGLIAQKTGGNADAIFKELSENLVTNARLVPAGVLAVNRAQERGYTFSYVA